MVAFATLAALIVGSAAPVHPPVKQPQFAGVQAVIGSDFRKPGFRDLARLLGSHPTLHNRGWDASVKLGRYDDEMYYLAWNDTGVECSLVGTEVGTIWLHNRVEYGARHLRFAAYAGELPAGLTLDDDVPTVIRKLGPPEEPHEAIGPLPAGEVFPARTETWLKYPTRGLLFVMWKEAGAAKEVISHIAVSKPEKP